MKEKKLEIPNFGLFRTIAEDAEVKVGQTDDYFPFVSNDTQRCSTQTLGKQVVPIKH